MKGWDGMAQSASIESGRLPHACLISAASREEALREARRLAAAAVCSGAGDKPCGTCRDCRKALSGVHPDIITVARPVDDKGKQKAQITVDQIRALSADAIVLPNEAERKVYILDEAETMNPAAQNAALKLLEEPPAGAVFLLCTVNPQLLLPTVRSRCAQLHIGASAADTADDAVKTLAAGYLKALGAGDEAQLLRWCAANEGVDGRTFAAFCVEARRLLTDALCCRSSLKGLTRGDMLRLCGLMETLIRYQKVNTGVKQLFGLLAVDSLGGSET